MRILIEKVLIDIDGKKHELTFSGPTVQPPAPEAVIDVVCSCGFNEDKNLHYPYPSLEQFPGDGSIDCALDAIMDHFPELNDE